MTYKRRLLDAELSQALETAGAVLIEGPRGCGKTSSAQDQANSSVRLDLDTQSRELAALSPQLVLAGETPRLIDEWQMVPEIFNHIRAEVDRRQKPGQFILTGSSRPLNADGIHPGAHRVLRLQMRPLTTSEWNETEELISLSDLTQGKQVSVKSESHELTALADIICKGGWPILQNKTPSQAIQMNNSYLKDVYRDDFDSVRPGSDSLKANAVVSALARNVSTEISTRALAREIGERLGTSIEPETVSDYNQALNDLSLVESVEPWMVHLRSKDVIRKSAKRYFVDPSLAVAALGASPETLIADLNTFGLLFENLAIRDLLVYAQNLGFELRHYRDSSGLEIDAILTKTNGDWFGIEIKLNPNRADEASQQLLRFREKLDAKKGGVCLGLAVLTFSEFNYQRADGVYVISVNQLTA